jgi:hypothetical protein
LIGSNEFKSDYGTAAFSTSEFGDQVYQDFLNAMGRLPTESELAAFDPTSMKTAAITAQTLAQTAVAIAEYASDWTGGGTSPLAPFGQGLAASFGPSTGSAQDYAVVSASGALTPVRGNIVSASSSTVYAPSNAVASITGSSDAIVAGANSTITATGSGDAATASGPGDVITIGGDGAGASNATEDTVTFASGGLLNEEANSRVDSYGNSVTASLLGSDVYGLYGSGDTVNASGTGDSVWMGQNGQSATGGNIDAINFAQSGGYAFELAGTNLKVTGNAATVVMTTNDSLTIVGTNEAFQFSTTTGADVLTGFSSTDSAQFSKTDFASFAALMAATTQAGTSTVIALDKSDSVTLTGVSKTSLTASEFHFV